MPYAESIQRPGNTTPTRESLSVAALSFFYGSGCNFSATYALLPVLAQAFFLRADLGMRTFPASTALARHIYFKYIDFLRDDVTQDLHLFEFVWVTLIVYNDHAPGFVAESVSQSSILETL